MAGTWPRSDSDDAGAIACGGSVGFWMRQIGMWTKCQFSLAWPLRRLLGRPPRFSTPVKEPFWFQPKRLSPARLRQEDAWRVQVATRARAWPMVRTARSVASDALRGVARPFRQRGVDAVFVGAQATSTIEDGEA